LESFKLPDIFGHRMEVEKKLFLPKNFWHSKKIPILENVEHSGNFFVA
jgi:hypothetical protein